MLSLTGHVHGRTIELDAPPSLPFDGKRVRVLLALDEPSHLSAEEQARTWKAWVASGPQGPIEDDGEHELP
jgi:hypothetical protein